LIALNLSIVLSTSNILQTALDGKQASISSTAGQLIIGNGNGVTATSTDLTFSANGLLTATNISTTAITASGLISANGGLTVASGQSLTSLGSFYVGAANGVGTIFLGGGHTGDGAYDHSVIESRAYNAGIEATELILFKGNDIGTTAAADRIRLRAGAIVFDTYSGASVSRETENINMVINGSGNVGIGTTDPSQGKLHVVGDMYVNGTITSSGNITAFQTLSDERLKIRIANIGESLNKIDKLNGFYYKVNELGHSYGIISTETEIGLSAQEVQKVLPELVDIAPFDKTKDKDGKTVSKSGENYLSISYERLAPLFVEAIKGLNEKNKLLINDNIELKEKYNKLSEDITLIKQKLNLQ